MKCQPHDWLNTLSIMTTDDRPIRTGRILRGSTSTKELQVDNGFWRRENECSPGASIGCLSPSGQPWAQALMNNTEFTL